MAIKKQKTKDVEPTQKKEDKVVEKIEVVEQKEIEKELKKNEDDEDDDVEIAFEEEVEEEDDGKTPKKEKYFEAIGRRKGAIARVRLFTKKASDVIPEGQGLILVNEKTYQDYFKDEFLSGIVESPLKRLKSLGRFKAQIKVSGGGVSGQADAIRHGLSRALVLFDKNFRKKLRRFGFLTRDARVKERKKYGLKAARRAPQWSKR